MGTEDYHVLGLRFIEVFTFPLSTLSNYFILYLIFPLAPGNLAPIHTSRHVWVEHLLKDNLYP